MRLHSGVYGHCKRVCTESRLWEKNPLPYREIEPTSAAWRSDALPTELHPHPAKICFFVFFWSPRKLTKTPCESQLFSLLLFVWKFYFISIYETFWFRLVHTACKCCLCLFHLLGELFVVILPYNRLRCFWIVHTVLVYAANSLECMRSPCSRAQPRLKLFQ